MLADRFTGAERTPAGDPDNGSDILGSGINPFPYFAVSRQTS
jgi:hypothetical protein